MEIVERWFGSGFNQLHPLLQQLHRQGGRLHGQVELQFGNGLAGLVGARLAARLGIPTGQTKLAFQVEIHSRADTLHWNRCFADGAQLCSTFQPRGRWPHGHWLETTGSLTLALGVQVRQGGWYWQPRRARLHGIPIPLWLLPRTLAYKRIENGLYHFYVGFSLPLLGNLLSYSGALHAEAPATGATQTSTTTVALKP